MKVILFVCTGNTCRSPMAEGMFRQLAKQAGLEVTVRSAGVSAMNHMEIADNSKQVLESKGIADRIVSQALTAELIEEADLILTMTMDHKRQVIERFNESVDKVYNLKEFVEDNREVIELIAKKEKLAAELQMKQSLSEEITGEERARLFELERSMPEYDVLDPIGGSLADYEQCALDIASSLHKLIDKLKDETR